MKEIIHDVYLLLKNACMQQYKLANMKGGYVSIMTSSYEN